jgi:hypothetical protein
MIKFNEDEWENSHCTCLNAQKHYYCNHIITVAAKLNKMDFEEVLMDLPLGKKLTRGRKKMPHCLKKPKVVTQQADKSIEVEEMPGTSAQLGNDKSETDEPSGSVNKINKRASDKTNNSQLSKKTRIQSPNQPLRKSSRLNP